MDEFRLGMLMAKIAMSLNDNDYNRVKPYMDELQDGILELINKAKEAK